MGANKTTYNNYKLTYDYHTHTTYSHGKGSIEDNVKAAIELGLKGIGIADHGPGHLTYGVKRDNLYVMKKEIEELRVKYPQIEILMSVEANIVSVGNNLDVNEDEKWIFVLSGLTQISTGPGTGVRPQSPSKCFSKVCPSISQITS